MVVLAVGLMLVGPDIGLNVLLVPRYGLEGAAWETTITGLPGIGIATPVAVRRHGYLFH